MAPPAGTLRVGRYFLSLVAILVILYALVFIPGRSHTPKLGIDLAGGTQVVFKARTPTGKTPAKSSMNEARTIMENRVDAFGVSNAEVVVQGSDQIQISVPGKSKSDIASIGAAAVLNFRPLVMAVVPTVAYQQAAAAASASASTSPSASASGTSTGSATTTPSSTGSTSAAADSPAPSATASNQDFNDRPLEAGSSTPVPTPTPSAAVTPTASATGTATATASPSASATTALSADPLKNIGFAVPTTDTAFAALTTAQQTALQTAMSSYDCSSKPIDNAAAKFFLACDTNDSKTASAVYLLGPIVVPGTEISSASAIAPGSQQGQTEWVVSLHLKSSGQASWAKWTAAHNTGGTTPTDNTTSCSATTTPCSDFVAFTLDNAVINAPFTQGTINGDTQISGGFTSTTANNLADQLKYGALPLSFDLQTNQTISATLGSGQLKAGLLAGGIGLILVVLYSLLYYRALGLVTIASLIVSGGLTYGSLVVLGREINFTLSLAGIAGFIVAIGITADSFVVFFERIKDEVHEGRSMRVAVPRAWVRARRTILSADTVSFLAAATLYYFAAGDVQGFAFTLGMSTILDLVVVFLFTHPLVSILSRSAAFGSARFTGLDSAREGGVFAGAEPAERRPVRPSGSGGKAAKATSSVAVLEREDDAQPVEKQVMIVKAPSKAAPAKVAPPVEPVADDATVAEPISAPAKRPAGTKPAAAPRRTSRRPKVEEPIAEEPAEDEAILEADDPPELIESEELTGFGADDADDDDDEDDGPVAPKAVRVRPNPGTETAAERAAARRAALRAKTDRAKTDRDGKS